MIRIIFALKKRFKSHDASDQKVHKYVYRRGQNAETGNLAASKEKHEKLGYNHKNSDERSLDQASWWNGVLDSRYLTLQCISGRMNIESDSCTAEKTQISIHFPHGDASGITFNSPEDHKRLDNYCGQKDQRVLFDSNSGERLPQVACEVPPGRLANSGPPKSGSPKRFLSVLADSDETDKEDSGSIPPFRSRKKTIHRERVSADSGGSRREIWETRTGRYKQTVAANGFCERSGYVDNKTAS